jgi:hypothetical protein
MKENKPLLIDTGGGYTIKYKNRYLYSKVNPVESVLKQVKHVSITENTVYFIPSCGLGYGLEELITRIPDNSHILCVEIEQALFYLAVKNASLPESPKLSVLRTEDQITVKKTIRELGLWNFRRLTLVSLCAGYRLYKNKYDAMARAVENEIQTYWKNKIILFHMGRLWIKNIILNLITLKRNYFLKDLIINKPVLVMGAGPSVEEKISWIREFRSKVCLLAIDTVLPVINSYKIKPDFIIILESQFNNIYDFISGQLFDVPVIADISSYAPLLRKFNNRIYFFSSRFKRINLFSQLQERGLLPDTIPPLGSVGVAAVYVALMLTKQTNPVFLLGLDFAYAYQKTHTRGVAHQEIMFLKSNRFYPMTHQNYTAIQSRPLLRKKGKDNIEYLTDLILYNYAGQLKELISKQNSIYDLSSVGLNIGVHNVRQKKEWKEILQKHSSDSTGDDTSLDLRPTQKSKGVHLKAIRDFILAEKDGIQRLVSSINQWLKEPAEKTIFTKEEEHFIKQYDYLYLHFPDNRKLPVFDRNFLTRLAVSARYYLKYFNQAERLLDSLFKVAS